MVIAFGLLFYGLRTCQQLGTDLDSRWCPAGLGIVYGLYSIHQSNAYLTDLFKSLPKVKHSLVFSPEACCTYSTFLENVIHSRRHPDYFIFQLSEYSTSENVGSVCTSAAEIEQFENILGFGKRL